jgi:hypothetical protein
VRNILGEKYTEVKTRINSPTDYELPSDTQQKLQSFEQLLQLLICLDWGATGSALDTQVISVFFPQQASKQTNSIYIYIYIYNM